MEHVSFQWMDEEQGLRGLGYDVARIRQPQRLAEIPAIAI